MLNFTLLQLTIEEAFKLCRYDWMRDALNKFLAALLKSPIDGTREELVELHIIPASNIGPESKMFSPGCFGKQSGVQHLEESPKKCVVQV